jgi:centromere/kinetochore protein ZW10
VTSLVAFQQLDKEAKQFWETLDELIMLPRSDLSSGTLRYIKVDGNTICTGAQTTDSTIKSLFIAMEDVIRFLVEHLPLEFRKPLSDVMMPELSARLKEFWLDTAVPASLDDMADYQKSLMQVHQFVERLQSLQWPGSEVFEDWISDAPKMWITKRRETALDWTRNQLGLGVGMRHPAKRVERRRVGRDESKKLASFGDKVTQDWDAAWGSEDEEMEEEMVEEETLLLGRNRASLEEHRRASEVTATIVEKPSEGDDDDAAEAWGWGDEDTVDGPNAQNASQPPQENSSHDQVNPETREVTLSENYYISSIPQPVFETVAGIFNDAAKLTSSAFEDSPVTPAASGLFNLPTLVLAMYRAVSPFHYTRHQCGNMFAYNDSIWLCDKLVEFQSEWEKRTDLSSRAYGRVKLGPEILNLESFGKRAYTNELNAQRTIINDLLGGAQNFFQENGSVKGNFEADIDGVLRHIRTVAASWEPILGYSVWASAVGSLVNTVAAKIISDIFDLDDVSVDGAARLASLISEVIKLDDLFLPSTHPRSKRSNEDSEDIPDLVPMTARFADKWMKLKFLSEVLQSNLSDVKYFWFESDLSLYFTADEVVELIGLSFENNANVRQAKREIKERPRPRVE